MSDIKIGIAPIIIEQVHRVGRRGIPAIAGVYCIINHSSRNLYYIGQSVDIRQRLTTSEMKWTSIPKDLDGWDVFIYPVEDDDQRNALEIRLIKKCGPTLNKQHNYYRRIDVDI